MIKSDMSDVGIIALIEHLREIEKRVVVQARHSDVGVIIAFLPEAAPCSSVSNMDVIAKWAELHRHSIFVQYDDILECISVKLTRLLPDSEYRDDEIFPY